MTKCYLKTRVADPDDFGPDPDPTFEKTGSRSDPLKKMDPIPAL
jgi:hypothetical protein